jgi:Peptidase family M1.
MSKVLDKEKFRLPSNVRPIRYEINLSPNLRKQNFNGNVNIQLNILETTSSISLNVAELEIKKVSIDNNSDNISNWEIDEDYEILKINFSNKIEIGEHNLSLE